MHAVGEALIAAISVAVVYGLFDMVAKAWKERDWFDGN